MALPSKLLLTQSCLTLWDPMDCSLPASSVHGILQARILEWVAMSFSRGSSWLRDQTWVSCIAGRFFTIWATKETRFLLRGISRMDWLGGKWESFGGPVVRTTQFHYQVPSQGIKIPPATCGMPPAHKKKDFLGGHAERHPRQGLHEWRLHGCPPPLGALYAQTLWW